MGLLSCQLYIAYLQLFISKKLAKMIAISVLNYNKAYKSNLIPCAKGTSVL